MDKVGHQRERIPGRALPGTRFKPGQQQRQQQQRGSWLWVAACLAGREGQAGHAVNPSMGARWRHPWRQRSCLPLPPRLRQFPSDGCTRGVASSLLDCPFRSGGWNGNKKGSYPFSCGKRIRPHNECAQRATRF
ncbi:Inosine-uridine preferring nucleoside hydrolase [Stenotrophomonas maltophilia D457]|nr:Inosine-uridine preferring nucleoside hydrolase [Stenotrophomonas maltophilia D457]